MWAPNLSLSLRFASPMAAALELTPELFVAEGADRQCYRHPDIPDRCIKVLHAERRGGRFWREIAYFRSLQQRHADFKHLTRFHGVIETSLGDGAMFDLVRDDDGQISRSLATCLEANDAEFNFWTINEMEALKQDFYDQWIVFHDLNPTNLMVKRLGYDKFRLVVIDGIGHDHFLPLASYSKRYARRVMRRRWNALYHQWYQSFPQVEHGLTPYSVRIL